MFFQPPNPTNLVFYTNEILGCYTKLLLPELSAQVDGLIWSLNVQAPICCHLCKYLRLARSIEHFKQKKMLSNKGKCSEYSRATFVQTEMWPSDLQHAWSMCARDAKYKNIAADLWQVFGWELKSKHNGSCFWVNILWANCTVWDWAITNSWFGQVASVVFKKLSDQPILHPRHLRRKT